MRVLRISLPFLLLSEDATFVLELMSTRLGLVIDGLVFFLEHGAIDSPMRSFNFFLSLFVMGDTNNSHTSKPLQREIVLDEVPAKTAQSKDGLVNSAFLLFVSS
ncbi:hypothetical protein PoB_001145700 [Plakobranchus ocellatus]|uniref:Uncharacterized protein n=1 Tax=Plakobranchus ocellatus TaxID=259542 RepID=A0AAV3YS38_9GAST|nr:hypothetical protein PoB_001145700 [Plakobranchus ocellatus]